MSRSRSRQSRRRVRAPTSQASLPSAATRGSRVSSKRPGRCWPRRWTRGSPAPNRPTPSPCSDAASKRLLPFPRPPRGRPKRRPRQPFARQRRMLRPVLPPTALRPLLGSRRARQLKPRLRRQRRSPLRSPPVRRLHDTPCASRTSASNPRPRSAQREEQPSIRRANRGPRWVTRHRRRGWPPRRQRASRRSWLGSRWKQPRLHRRRPANLPPWPNNRLSWPPRPAGTGLRPKPPLLSRPDWPPRPTPLARQPRPRRVRRPNNCRPRSRHAPMRDPALRLTSPNRSMLASPPPRSHWPSSGPPTSKPSPRARPNSTPGSRRCKSNSLRVVPSMRKR